MSATKTPLQAIHELVKHEDISVEQNDECTFRFYCDKAHREIGCVWYGKPPYCSGSPECWRVTSNGATIEQHYAMYELVELLIREDQ